MDHINKCPMAHTAGPLYVSESTGSDENGRGTEEQPFKTILQVSLRFIMYSMSHR